MSALLFFVTAVQGVIVLLAGLAAGVWLAALAATGFLVTNMLACVSGRE